MGTSNQTLSAYAEKWIDGFLEDEYKGAQFLWSKEKADSFASTPIETLLFDEYFLNVKSWAFPGVIDLILDLYEEKKKRPISLVAVVGGFGCLPEYAPIKTNNGYINIGNLSVGDKILGVNGNTTKECSVINKSYSGKKEVFRVYTKDGNYIDATKEHIFKVWVCEYNIGRVSFEWSIGTIINYLDNNIEIGNFISLIRINDNQTNEIIRYESLGYMDTYDISIDNESKCFLSYNDFITHNSGKTAGVGSLLNWLSWFDFSCRYKKESAHAIPQEHFDLKPTSKVAFIALSKTADKSKDITFSEMILPFHSHFNQDYFPVNDRIKSRIDIPLNNTLVFPNTATEAANAGWNIYNYVLDEISFLEITDNSSRAKGSTAGTYDQAQAAHKSAEGRRFSRFQEKGLGVLLSSVNFDEDYLMTLIRRAYSHVDSDHVYYKVLVPWLVNPHKYNKKEYFYFDTVKSEIIQKEEEILLLDREFISMPIEDVVFGDSLSDPNAILLNAFREGK